MYLYLSKNDRLLFQSLCAEHERKHCSITLVRKYQSLSFAITAHPLKMNLLASSEQQILSRV